VPDPQEDEGLTFAEPARAPQQPPGGAAPRTGLPPGGASVNEDLLDAFLREGRPLYRLYEPRRPLIVLGSGRRPELDVHLEAARRDGLAVLRRRGGGGTVVLSPGQVVLALVAEVSSPFQNREYARAINGWFREALEGLGVRRIEDRGISDLAIGERKILGTTLYRRRTILFYQASLLVGNDLSLFSRYLAYPSVVPDYRRGRGHEEFCTSLEREGYPLAVERVIDALGGVVSRRLPLLR
jgi:lipoate-protein ligase A